MILGILRMGPGPRGEEHALLRSKCDFRVFVWGFRLVKTQRQGDKQHSRQTNKKIWNASGWDRRPDQPKLRTTCPVAAHHGFQARNICLPPLLLLNLYLSQAWLYGQRREESDVETRIWKIEVMRYTERLKQ